MPPQHALSSRPGSNALPCSGSADSLRVPLVLSAQVREAHDYDAETAFLEASEERPASADARRRRQLGSVAGVISQTRSALTPRALC